MIRRLCWLVGGCAVSGVLVGWCWPYTYSVVVVVKSLVQPKACNEADLIG